MTNWKLGSITDPFAQNNLCDRWGQQGFWMWKKCPHCGGLPQRGESVERRMEIFHDPQQYGTVDNSLKRVGVYAINVSIALLPLAGRKEHFPDRVENWDFDMEEAKNDFTEWKTLTTNGTEGHRVGCDGCGNVSSIEDWDVEPADLWIPEEGEIIGFAHSDGTDYGSAAWGCYVYEAVPRKSDDKLTWRRLKEHDNNVDRSSYNDAEEMCDGLVEKDIRVTNRRVMNVSPGSNLRHGAKVRERKELTAELLRSF